MKSETRTPKARSSKPSRFSFSQVASDDDDGLADDFAQKHGSRGQTGTYLALPPGAGKLRDPARSVSLAPSDETTKTDKSHNVSERSAEQELKAFGKHVSLTRAAKRERNALTASSATIERGPAATPIAVPVGLPVAIQNETDISQSKLLARELPVVQHFQARAEWARPLLEKALCDVARVLGSAKSIMQLQLPAKHALVSVRLAGGEFRTSRCSAGCGRWFRGHCKRTQTRRWSRFESPLASWLCQPEKRSRHKHPISHHSDSERTGGACPREHRFF